MSYFPAVAQVASLDYQPVPTLESAIQASPSSRLAVICCLVISHHIAQLTVYLPFELNWLEITLYTEPTRGGDDPGGGDDNGEDGDDVYSAPADSARLRILRTTLHIPDPPELGQPDTGRAPP